MGVGRTAVRIGVSIVGALIPLLFLSGSFSPFGSYLPNLFGSQSALGDIFSSFTGGESNSALSAFLPLGTAGITGIFTFSILQRVLGAVERAANSTPSINPDKMLDKMFSSMQIPGMPLMGAQQDLPATLPPDLTRAQFLVLRSIRSGNQKSGNVAKAMSMDKTAVQSEMNTLRSNGYITKDNGLTSKAMEVLGQ